MLNWYLTRQGMVRTSLAQELVACPRLCPLSVQALRNLLMNNAATRMQAMYRRRIAMRWAGAQRRMAVSKVTKCFSQWCASVLPVGLPLPSLHNTIVPTHLHPIHCFTAPQLGAPSG
jgi:hypothetical protein